VTYGDGGHAIMDRSLQRTVSFFSNLPDETSRQFELEITQYVEDDPGSYVLFRKIIESGDLSLSIRYAAFFALCTYYRRYKESTKLFSLLIEFEGVFSQFGTFDLLYSMALRERGRKVDVQESIQRSVLAKKKLPGHAGILHNYAHGIASYVEDFGIDGVVYAEAVDEAVACVDMATSENPGYAKFYCTRGRLMACKGMYDEAIMFIRKAIDCESPTKKDYAIRISEYMLHLNRIQISKMLNVLDDQVQDGKRSIQSAVDGVRRITEEARTRNLEFLGFFAAIISFTIGGLQLAQRQPVLQSAQLIIVLASALLVSFSGLGIMLYGTPYTRRALLLLGVGIGLCVFGFTVLPIIAVTQP